MHILIVIVVIASIFLSQFSALPIQGNSESFGNQKEFGGNFDGDIIITPYQLEVMKHPVRSRNALAEESYLWPNGKVYFIFSEEIDDEYMKHIWYGMQLIEKTSCVKFIYYKPNVTDYILITSSSRGCFSYLGRQGGKQILNLEKGHCNSFGAIAHEFLHALGFLHQHSVWNRDDYIKIHEENIKPEQMINFLKYVRNLTTDYGVPYDYWSVMHYGPREFSSNGKITIETLDPDAQDIIGQRLFLSDSDIKRVNLMYNCEMQ